MKKNNGLYERLKDPNYIKGLNLTELLYLRLCVNLKRDYPQHYAYVKRKLDNREKYKTPKLLVSLFIAVGIYYSIFLILI